MTSLKALLSVHDLLLALQGYPECGTAFDLASNPLLTTIAPVESAESGSLTFLEAGKSLALLENTQASAILLPLETKMQQLASDRGIAWIASTQPKLLFARAVSLFYQPQRPPLGIHPTAIVDPTAQVGEGVSIGAYVVIGPEAIIEDEVCLHPHVVIYGGAQIGKRSVIHAQAVIHERAILGSDCVIHSGAVIGSEGFGFVPSSQGWVKLDQAGYTVLEDRVEVGCNSAVDRPAMGETRLGQNTKIDNLVQIGHNCQLGQNCLMAGQSGLAGSVTLEENVILAGQAGIVNQIHIGKGSILSSRTGVIQDVAPGQVVSGHPAQPHRQWLKTATVYPYLPEMQRSLRALQAQVQALEMQIAAYTSEPKEQAQP